MELIRGLYNVRPQHRGCVLTIGNFDGVHLGHQAVLKKLIDKARELSLPATLMLFEPQPLELFLGDKAPARLSRLRDKLAALERLGMDRVIVEPFTPHFASLEPQAFIQQQLVERLGVQFLVVGDDFRFGHGRKGDFAMLEAAAAQHGFTVTNTDSFCLVDDRVSSTRIREALQDSRLADAETMLGRPYSISGRVHHGAKMGRTIGFPTVNLPLKRKVSPVKGVFAVDVLGADDSAWPGIANIGVKPTVNGKVPTLEVHLLDFDGDLYGSQLEVVLRKKLRDEQRFASLDALRDQIEKDEQAARAFFANRKQSLE
ncbi:bifunctional riboflavin kinase/FAD synthetase [Gallaecimonas pentaromativorans]|uniref:Riboflavin biosynthesis protein n=1 Tax=Gallaecimonas pentaromativorans TaxID=584787 RepID=A0A3N1P2S3_9GAMM|nr:bifunctional riboflavin kinase/FAD synthetase [Gallaecimonas pentaromativorans]MED5523955.1 bifunctional riboflavin kinase/FAD synthetase [Pseudomonadota bacterium]ROQ22379.1 FMN adenylyltransferase /riboflavin kinase [Gallaecimonas pentaromativorans]